MIALICGRGPAGERKGARVELDGKVALVTGAGRGIGAARATAEALPTKAAGFQADITDSGAVRAAVGAAVDTLGPVDVLVNNAGWDKIEPFVDNEESDWD